MCECVVGDTARPLIVQTGFRVRVIVPPAGLAGHFSVCGGREFQSPENAPSPEPWRLVLLFYGDPDFGVRKLTQSWSYSCPALVVGG